MKFAIGTVSEARLPEMSQRAQLVEKLGFEQLWVADERLMHNVCVTLALAAQSTTSLRLGTAVTNPYTRNPALTAAAIASVDELSGGRTVLGIGAGGGLENYGLERRRPVTAIREAVHAIQRLTAGERVDVGGEVFSFRGAELNFKPLRQVPIYIAARGPKILELAGEIADGVIVGGFAKPDGIAFAKAHVERGLERSKRDWADLHRVAWLYTSVHPDRERARSAVSDLVVASLVTSRPILDRIGVELSQALRHELDQADWILTQDLTHRASTSLDDGLLDSFSVAGTAAECAAKLASVAACGFDQIALVVQVPEGSTPEEQIRLIAEDVLPQVGALGVPA